MIGRDVPDIVFKTRVRDETVEGPNPFRWQDVKTSDIFAGKRIVVFSLPGAFTPTCSNEQCPAYERYFADFQKQGVSDVYCISVNDAFVMYQWGKQLGVDKIKLLPDGSADFTRRMGMLIRKDHVGFGERSWRYAMIVDDGKITGWFEEPGINDQGLDDDPYGESAPDKVLAWLETHPA
ncbi:peroxiredoxin [Sphingomonas sp. BIUV-7]|uniref:Glutathione-dependent peroxiredoxin n=1 Tax=Sphingomonas natans TaxID=3063330 RepID=A0ABT8Y407_9SPHN|nr:peroxiredoxin [Sphingomonas sp. BIUV-7]MDO6413045.1 peroxiredoxin [Sphingomonas sp. BIUV-7]